MGRAIDVARKRPNPRRDLIQLRAEPEWIDRVNAEAERLGLSLSAYIRLAVNERMERTAPEGPPPRKRKDGER
ncbi:MAG TPA: hypothetical protein VKD72_36205 [Gemmataceae bacterium]|nr:hypothetical protein [Gemmataceae bacterium]